MNTNLQIIYALTCDLLYMANKEDKKRWSYTFYHSKKKNWSYTFGFVKMPSYPIDLPSSTSFTPLSPFSSNSCESSSDRLSFPGIILELAFFSTSTAELYTTMPTTARTTPSMFFRVNSESKSSHPNVKTHTVFMWPKTWKVTAEKRPMQRYWLTLQNTAREQESSIKNCINSKDS